MGADMFDQYGDFKRQLPDRDSAETEDWVDSLDIHRRERGHDRAQFILYRLLKRARQLNIGLPPLTQTRYINTISPEQEPEFPGDEEMELRIRRMVRWNAVAMVLRANAVSAGIGGHLATYASAASLYEVGFNHFFRGKDAPGMGDQIFFQGHAAPGIYARAFLEGRLSEDAARPLPPGGRARAGPELVSAPAADARLLGVPHGLDGPRRRWPRIYQARFNRYLHHRGIKDTSRQPRVGVPGRRRDRRAGVPGLALDRRARGPRQPDLRRQLQPAAPRRPGARQRQDHPGARVGLPRRRLERDQGHLGPRVGRAAGAATSTACWSHAWARRSTASPRSTRSRRGAYIREHFFGADPRLLALVADMSDDEIKALRRGGHDYRKVYAAYRRRRRAHGPADRDPGPDRQGLDAGHPASRRATSPTRPRSSTRRSCKIFRDRLELPISDAKLKDAPYYHPGPDSPEIQYLMERRARAGRPDAAPRRGHQDAGAAGRSGLRRVHARLGHPGSVAPRWPSPSCCATCCATRASASASCRSSPTRRARSAWIRSSRRSASTPRWASATTRSTRTWCCHTARRRTARCSRRASRRPARRRRSRRPARRTRPTASR